MVAYTMDAIPVVVTAVTGAGGFQGPPPINFSTYTDSDLAVLATAVQTEQMHRAILVQAAAQINAINVRCMTAQGVVQGAAWVQPTDATNAYPLDWVVTYGGNQWQSLIPANTHIPGDPNDPQAYRWWKNLTVVPPAGAWAPGVAYKVGDMVTYNGQSYKCLQAHTSQPDWTPPAVPALWQPVATH